MIKAYRTATTEISVAVAIPLRIPPKMIIDKVKDKAATTAFIACLKGTRGSALIPARTACTKMRTMIHAARTTREEIRR